jgi:hypothetical protein
MRHQSGRWVGTLFVNRACLKHIECAERCLKFCRDIQGQLGLHFRISDYRPKSDLAHRFFAAAKQCIIEAEKFKNLVMNARVAKISTTCEDLDRD